MAAGQVALALAVLGLVLFASVCEADVYMHHPRGSNNRLNERSANRNNGNRMFDSQNNNRGGYNKGDLTDQAFTDYASQYDMIHFMSDPNWKTNNRKSVLGIEWTNQHGCGGNELGDPHKLNCEIVIQYMCASEAYSFDVTRDDCTKECFVPIPANPDCSSTVNPCPVVEMNSTGCAAAGYLFLDAKYFDEFNCVHKCSADTATNQYYSKVACEAAGGTWASFNTNPNGPWPRMRDGLNTNTQDYTEPTNGQLTAANDFDRKDGDDHYDRGLHESWEYYDECYRRERNAGLFTADQNLQNNRLGYSSASYTRQQPNANQRGYECQEERDYYPYWHPSPWRDVVIMTDRLDLCPFYQSESQNVKAKGKCFNKDATSTNCMRYNTQGRCEANNCRWTMMPSHNISAPDCIQAPWSRVNHLGNGRHGQANSYNWTLPYIGDGSTQRCVVRLRYNISTDDYDAWRVNASFNNNDGQGIRSPVKQNPNVDIGAGNQALRLAINTAQFGRTFQDRSHVFRLVPRPTGTRIRPSTAFRGTTATPDFFSSCSTLYNLNVRGKRGNIVQTFPAVEYDFYPNQLHINTDDCVHVQWTGSNTHNNGNPAGDGQAGDAGEGRGGTDRHNFVEMSFDFAESFPVPFERFTMFSNITDAYDPVGTSTRGYDFLDTTCACASCSGTPAGAARDACYANCWETTKQNWALRMATVGYYDSFDCTASNNRVTNGNRDKLNNQLDNAYASFPGGIFKFPMGKFQYMCTRNHNFSNRDQKGKLIVSSP